MSAILERAVPAIRKFGTVILASILATGGLSTVSAERADAATTVTVGAVELDFSSSKRTATSNNTSLNGTATYTNVATIDGIQIDAVVTTVGLNNSSITNYDSIGSASANDKYFQINNNATAAGGFTAFKFEFFDHADGSVAVLKNVSVTSIDLDSPGRQFTEFSGFQSYILSADTKLTPYTTNHTGAALTDGLVRFTQTRTTTASSSNNDPFSAVEVKFAEMSSYVAVFGNEEAQGGYFGVSFKSLCSTATGTAGGSCTTAAAQSNPNNSAPTSTSTTSYFDSANPVVLTLSNFPYADIDNNAFSSIRIDALPASGTLEYFNGTAWVTAPTGTAIPVADIQLGYLRYTGAGSSFTYSVNDGLVYSSSSYTLTLAPSTNSQQITFANPGNKAPTDPAFASNATSNSGLNVTLTSLTPSTCTVSGLNIVPVAAGACTITASQSGNSTYGAATDVTQTFYITNDAAQTITFANPGSQTWSGSSFTIPTTPTATSGLAVTLSSFSPSVCTVSGSTITIVGPGTCQIRATQGGGASGGTTYAAAPPVTISFPVSAPVTPASYTITYGGNSNTGGTTPSNTTGNGSVTLASNSGTLVRTGYTFAGWNTAANGSGTHYDEADTYNLTASITLYAQWTAVTPASYTITYGGNSNTGGTTPSNTTGNGSVTLASNSGTLVRTGYTFAGWNTAANGSGTHYDEADTYNLTASITLYAQWTAVPPVAPSINFSGNGATSGATSPEVNCGQNQVCAPAQGELRRPGYRFMGWNTRADGRGTQYAPGDVIDLSGSVTLYAMWEEETGLASTGYAVASAATVAGGLLFIGLALAGLRRRRI